MRNGERGFTYLLLLFAMAAGGVALAALGEQWVTLMQRDREAELLFRGREIAAALASWRDSTPAGQPVAPEDLQQLLTDTRTTPPRHHLRRLYTDPFTGQADWLLLRDDQGRITAVASRSRQPALARPRLPQRAPVSSHRPSVGDWLFEPPEAVSAEPPSPSAQAEARLTHAPGRP